MSVDPPPFIQVSQGEVWRIVMDMHDLEPSSPLVRQVLESKDRIRALDLKFYAILGAITTGIVGSVALRLAGLA